MIADFAAGHVRHALIEQSHQKPYDLGFRLPAKAQQNKIVARKDCVYNLRNYGIFIADDAGEKRFPPLQSANQVLSQLIFNGSLGGSKILGSPKSTECFGKAE